MTSLELKEHYDYYERGKKWDSFIVVTMKEILSRATKGKQQSPTERDRKKNEHENDAKAA